MARRTPPYRHRLRDRFVRENGRESRASGSPGSSSTEPRRRLRCCTGWPALHSRRWLPWGPYFLSNHAEFRKEPAKNLVGIEVFLSDGPGRPGVTRVLSCDLLNTGRRVIQVPESD